MGNKQPIVNKLIEKFFMQIGERLKEERERLGYNQTDFAALASATRKTLFNWESDSASPNIAALEAWAEIGLDVLYVVTGQRDGPAPLALTAEEQTMLDYFRQSSKEVRRAALGALLGAAPAGAGAGNSARTGNMNNTAPGGVQVGFAGGKVSVKKGK